jgi:hypothetical protein
MKEIPRSRYESVLELYREYLRIEKWDPETARRMNVRWTIRFCMQPPKCTATRLRICDISAKRVPMLTLRLHRVLGPWHDPDSSPELDGCVQAGVTESFSTGSAVRTRLQLTLPTIHLLAPGHS